MLIKEHASTPTHIHVCSHAQARIQTHTYTRARTRLGETSDTKPRAPPPPPAHDPRRNRSGQSVPFLPPSTPLSEPSRVAESSSVEAGECSVMWSYVLLDPLSLVPQPPVDLHAGDADVSPRERVSEPLHRLHAHRANLHLFLAARLDRIGSDSFRLGEQHPAKTTETRSAAATRVNFAIRTVFRARSAEAKGA